ncbi:MAG: signal peptide peptidase SppA [Cyanobacteria bacterium NC_groundwater_1444_Ag_S-0.65um_54_12]|nr:signal peptide peptidase SppA [Cyanobacteria bacterium NC_groundwater_1444_Ag_S-0.65um_54_12]
MHIERILAGILITLSLVAAVGVWIVRPATNNGQLALPLASSLSGGSAEIALFDCYGMISDGLPDSPWGGSSGVNSSKIISLLRQSEKDGVKVILLRINSSGGTAAASQAIYQELMRIRRAGKIKIVAAFGDMAASGAYFIAAAAHHIVSLPTSTTGSIGVITHVHNVAGLLNKIGVQDTVFKSGQYKDLLSSLRPIANDERIIIQRLIDSIYEQFLAAVTAGRPQLSPAKLRTLADGRIFTGEQALRVGLVDSLGNYSDALNKAAILAGIKGDPQVKVYTTQGVLETIIKLESRLSSYLAIKPSFEFPAKMPLALLE